MKRTFVATMTIVALLVSVGVVFALEKFISYRNLSPSSDEYVLATPDVNFAIKQGYVNHYLLVASTKKDITVPTGSKFAVFSADADIWVDIGGAAAIPAGDVTDGTGSELNPTVRYLGDETVISVISASAAKLSIMFYE